MRDSRNKRIFPVFVLFAYLWLSCLSAASGLTDTQTKAEQMASSLHDSFEDNVAFNHLQNLYDSLHCSKEDIDMRDMLHNIVEPVSARLRASMMALQQYKYTAENASKIQQVNVTGDCCLTASTHYSDRFHSNVDLSSGCAIQQTPLNETGNTSLDTELLSGFMRTLNESSVVVWQYYGSVDGKYLQYPASSRYCDGPTSQFDPRFKAWYVETASPVKKNLVIIIDRSGSMSGKRLKLAIDAALTVLDTLSPEDNVGILAFSHKIGTPSGCFGTTVAKGTPANLDKLREWLLNLRALGSTWYAPAFRHAFSMFQNVTANQTSERKNVILFLTDGNPSDNEAGIFQAIKDGQLKMNHSVQINTYALGTGISYDGLQRLQYIASNNSGVFREIKDQQGGLLTRLMGSYYTSIKTPLRQHPRLSVPRRDMDLGLTVTMSLALTQNGSLRGVVAQDLLLERLFKEALQVSAGPLSYAILIDNEGRTILHPSLPGPSDNTSSQSFLPLSLLEPQLPPDVISNITGRGSGFGSFQTGFSLPRGGQTTDGTHTIQANATYLWSPVGSSVYSLILVVAEGQSVRPNLTSYKPSFQSVTSFYHRLDLTWNSSESRPQDVCSLSRRLTSPGTSTVKITPAAFNDSEKYIYTTETLKDVQHIEQFFNENSSQAKYNGLNMAIRSKVLLTSELERLWKMANIMDPGAVRWRFVGTQNGVLRMYPGLRLHKTYTHKQQSWYRQAVSSPGTLVMSSSTSTYQHDKVFSFSKTIHKSSCRSPRGSNKVGDVMAVIGMDMTESALRQLINENMGLNKENQTDWYVLVKSGRIVFNLSSPRMSAVDEPHLTEAFPWLASSLIRKHKTLKGLWCNNYEQHQVKLFYELTIGPDGASSNSTEPCRQFEIHQVPGTSLYLLTLPSRGRHHCTEDSQGPHEECHCGSSCSVCSSAIASTCQCPCSCAMSYDECKNSVKSQWTTTPCPVPAPPLYDTEKEEFALQEALLSVPICAKDCGTIRNATECVKTMGCHWCSVNAIPSCNAECRTSQSLSLLLLFPCNNFMNMSAIQQKHMKYLIKRALVHQVSFLSALNLGTLELRQEGVLLQLYATTTNNDLKLVQEQIQEVIKDGNLVVGPTTDFPQAYSAKSPDELTDLNIVFNLEPSLSHLSEDVRMELGTKLQSLLFSLLGKSFFSTIHRLRVNKTSVQFSLSNDGYTDVYPIRNLVEVLQKAVSAGRFSFHIPLVESEAASQEITVRSMSSHETFDFLCNPTTSVPATKTVKTVTSSGSTTVTGRSRTAAPSKRDGSSEPGLTPVEIAVLVTASALILASCPCILFMLLTKRRRSPRGKKVSPEDDPEEDLPSDISQLSVLDADMDILVNQAYSPPPSTRIPLSPREAWAKAKLLTIPPPKNVPEGAWF